MDYLTYLNLSTALSGMSAVIPILQKKKQCVISKFYVHGLEWNPVSQLR